MAARAICLQGGGPSAPNLARALAVCAIESTQAVSSAQLVDFVDRFSTECVVLLCATSDLDPHILELAAHVRCIDRSCPIIIFTPSLSAEGTVQAMRAGVSDVLENHASADSIAKSLCTVLEPRRSVPSRQVHGTDLIDGSKMVGSGQTMANLRRKIARVASAETNVLITGESGTGKELAAELIHKNSRQGQHPFVAVNCAAVPDALLESELFGYERGAFTGATTARQGKLQYASGGTFLLDEIGDMSLALQAKILRAIETRMVQRLGSNIEIPVQVRFLAATNQNLESLTSEKKFRQDLYFRLNVVRLELPPLRERIDDIPELADHILRDLNQNRMHPVHKIEPDALRRLIIYSWPGNVRELRNVLESAVVFSNTRSVGLSDLPVYIRKPIRSSCTSACDERSKIVAALTSADWNRSKAAEILHCSRMTLYRKMVKLSLIPER